MNLLWKGNMSQVSTPESLILHNEQGIPLILPSLGQRLCLLPLLLPSNGPRLSHPVCHCVNDEVDTFVGV